MVEFYIEHSAGSKEKAINSFGVVREEVRVGREVFPTAVMLNPGFERWVDGNICILGWVILGARVIGIKKENLSGKLEVIQYDWRVGIKGRSQSREKGQIMETLYIRLDIVSTTDFTWNTWKHSWQENGMLKYFWNFKFWNKQNWY